MHASRPPAGRHGGDLLPSCAALVFLANVCLPAAAAAGEAFPAAPPSPGPATAALLRLTLGEAVLMSLENNRGLRVERLAPAIARTGELQAASAFDLLLDGSLSAGWSESPAAMAATGEFSRSDSQHAELGATRFFSPGTTVKARLSADRSASPESDTSRLGLSVTQSLLQGRGAEVNLAAVHQAGLDSAASDYELRGFTESLAAQVEEAYWDYLLAGRNEEIVERSLRLAEDQLAEVRERIAVGRLAEIEQAAAEAEAATRREALINARSARATARIRLLRLLTPPGSAALERELVAAESPVLPPPETGTVAEHVALAQRARPELNQARLQLRRDELEVVRTRNGLLPRLDFFLTLGKSGYASSFGDSVDLGGKGYDAQVGLTLQFPWENRAARAAHERARLSQGQAEESLANLAQLVEVDVRTAWIEAQRLREQVAATEVALRLQREKLRAETEKFRVGKSTAFLVAQAQRDQLQAEIEAESAVAGCLKATVELYRLEGSLLSRRRVLAPGAQPPGP